MNTERQPLLMEAEMQGRGARPDMRESPESALVDVKNDDGGMFCLSLLSDDVID